MYLLVMIVHVISSLVLILVILLQAGRGGGLADIAGGQPQSILGTQTNAFMTRATEVCAIIFILTSLTLGIMSTHRGKSLMERRNLSKMMQTRAAAVQMPTEKAEKANQDIKAKEAAPSKNMGRAVGSEAVQPATAAAPVAEAKTPVEGNAK